VRCGTNGERGRVGDREPWTRVGVRCLVARERERISEGIEGLGFGGIYTSLVGWAKYRTLGFFNIYHMHSTCRKGHNVDPDGIEFGDKEHVSFSASLDGG